MCFQIKFKKMRNKLRIKCKKLVQWVFSAQDFNETEHWVYNIERLPIGENYSLNKTNESNAENTFNLMIKNLVIILTKL